MNSLLNILHKFSTNWSTLSFHHPVCACVAIRVKKVLFRTWRRTLQWRILVFNRSSHQLWVEILNWAHFTAIWSRRAGARYSSHRRGHQPSRGALTPHIFNFLKNPMKVKSILGRHPMCKDILFCTYFSTKTHLILAVNELLEFSSGSGILRNS